MNRFFFITTYDKTSADWLAYHLNTHTNTNASLAINTIFKKDSSCHSLDHLIQSQPESHKTPGMIAPFSAYELRHKLILERSTHPIRKINIVMPPQWRTQFILNEWLNQYREASTALANIEKQLESLKRQQHTLFSLYRFDYFYQTILETIAQENISLTTASDKLFIIALAIVITFDTADLPCPGKVFYFDKLIQDPEEFNTLLHYLGASRLSYNETPTTIAEETEKQIQHWKAWQINLLHKCLFSHLRTVYYPHINQSLAGFYENLGYTFNADKQTKHPYSKLISLHLNSNRPGQLVNFFDNIEETADHPSDIEVLINIDEGDGVMQQTIEQEIPRRAFTIKYLTSPRPDSFYDLWKPLNKLLTLIDPNAYFVLNTNDEIAFATKGWDTVLKKYVGYYPDHLFRLRTSRNKFRNYFDPWECSFAQEALPITTKKWFDVTGDWNPCFGPDSFQQLIAFYLAKEGQFSSLNYLRDVPILDIQFHIDIPSLGVEAKKAWQLTRGSIYAMQTCQSYAMQKEACRRAMLLKSNMLAAAMQLTDYEVIDIPHRSQIHLLDKTTGKVLEKSSYQLNWFTLTLKNQLRKLRFNSYFGGGKKSKKWIIFSFAGYLKAKYHTFQRLYLLFF